MRREKAFDQIVAVRVSAHHTLSHEIVITLVAECSCVCTSMSTADSGAGS